ncbi:MAG: metal-dependent hydrolase [Deltaproteobacteria bacterium]|nr:metal-dependent hydrolase [Deltaproteobacteria bacterium]
MTIERRDVDLDFDPASVPRDWCRGDAYETTFMNALSLLFPDGERFFVEAVKQHRHLVASPELLADVVGFIGQEAMHGKEHRAFNQLIATQFPQAPRLEKRVRAFLLGVRRVLSPRSQLAVTCALEHFTAMLAEGLLSDERLRGGIDPQVLPLWMWHALEESEHKAVAFDVYRAAGGGYARRAALMAVTTVIFLAVHAIVHAHLMATRGILARPWRWARPLVRLWIYPGHFGRLVPAYLAYFAPRFHPDDRDTRALVDAWRERLFGAHGQLAA